jgi:small-conductance mechanosensitive channel
MPPTPALDLPGNFLEIVLALALAATLAGVCALAAGRLARRALASIHRDAHLNEPLTRGTVRVVRFMTFIVSFAVFAFPALSLAGVDWNVGLHPQELGRWAAETGVRILAILVLAFVVVRVLTGIITRAERDIAMGAGLDALERRKRAQTISSVVRRGLSALIWTTAGLVVLRELDVDITPVLTGAGIVGLAVGFGAQTLVKDIISGLFLIAEDQVRLGDVAEINNIGGSVEEINLRTIVLRDLEGTLHYIANGEIRTLANKSKDFSYYVIDIGVGYDDDTDRIVDAVREVARELMVDPAFTASILEPIEVLGVDAFKASEVTLRFRLKTLPMKQWEVGRELRRRIKIAFDAAGIKIPGPQMTVTVKQ